MRELIQLCDGIFASQPMPYWQRALEEADVPYSVVATLDDVVADKQMQANGVFVEIDDPVLGRVRTVDTPMQIEGHPKVTRTPAPRLGEHTARDPRRTGPGRAGDPIAHAAPRGRGPRRALGADPGAAMNRAQKSE